jgi:hypothetical protein
LRLERKKMKLVTFLLWGLIAILVFPISCFCAFLWILFSCCSPCFAECGAVLEAMWKGTTLVQYCCIKAMGGEPGSGGKGGGH